MPKISMWNHSKGLNYKYIDNHIRQQMEFGGTAVFVHKYLGPQTTDKNLEIREKSDATQPDLSSKTNSLWENIGSTERDIQDLLYLENRDRKYDKDIYELRGVYQINDSDFDLKQFGIFLSGDVVLMHFHINDMINRLGRAIMSGDVLELPHMKNNFSLDPSIDVVNKYYVVDEADKAAEGFSPTWYPHVWRCKCSPMQASQEFAQILNKPAVNSDGEFTGKTVYETNTTGIIDETITNAIVEEATRQTPHRNWETKFLYMMPYTDPETGKPVPFHSDKWPIILNYGDGVPPNGAILAGSGTRFPSSPNDGDFFLRMDYEPNVLFRRQKNIWVREEYSLNTPWNVAHDQLANIINNTGTISYQNTGEVKKQRQSISKIFLKDDFE